MKNLLQTAGVRKEVGDHLPGKPTVRDSWRGGDRLTGRKSQKMGEGAKGGARVNINRVRRKERLCLSNPERRGQKMVLG